MASKEKTKTWYSGFVKELLTKFSYEKETIHRYQYFHVLNNKTTLKQSYKDYARHMYNQLKVGDDVRVEDLHKILNKGD